MTTAELTELLRTMRAEGVARFSLHPDGTPAEVVLGPLPGTGMQPLATKVAEDDEELLFGHERVA